jgi:hypothetical protein
MKLTLKVKTLRFPVPISPEEALHFHLREPEKHAVLMVVAADWLTNPEPDEEDWFLELTEDELGSEDFLEDFREARLQFWAR